jgi:hypothetical protein
MMRLRDYNPLAAKFRTYCAASCRVIGLRVERTIANLSVPRHDLRDLPVSESVLDQLHHLQKCSPA